MLVALIMGFIRVTQLTQIREKEKFPARSFREHAGKSEFSLRRRLL
jgi:hypothetical protein